MARIGSYRCMKGTMDGELMGTWAVYLSGREMVNDGTLLSADVGFRIELKASWGKLI